MAKAKTPKGDQDKLNAMHAALCDAYTELLFDKEVKEVLNHEGDLVLIEKRTATPALLAAAGKFLSDNGTFVDKEMDDHINFIQERLKNKTKRTDSMKAKVVQLPTSVAVGL